MIQHPLHASFSTRVIRHIMTEVLLCRYNARITEEAATDSEESAVASSATAVRQLSLAKAPTAPLSGVLQSLGYLHKPGTEDDLKPITHWVVADVASQVSLMSVANTRASLMNRSTLHHQRLGNRKLQRCAFWNAYSPCTLKPLQPFMRKRSPEDHLAGV